MKSGSGDVPDEFGKVPIGADVFQMDIRDTTGLGMRFLYRGFELGVGTPAFDEGSDWKSFTTNLGIRLTDFAGFARHTSVQAQVSVRTFH